MESIDLSSLSSIGSYVYLYSNTELEVVDLSSLTCVDNYTIEGNDLSEDDQYDLLVQISGC